MISPGPERRVRSWVVVCVRTHYTIIFFYNIELLLCLAFGNATPTSSMAASFLAVPSPSFSNHRYPFFPTFLVCLLINIRLLFHLFNVFLSCYYLNYDILVLFYPVVYLSKVIICYSLIPPFFSIYLLYFIQFKFLEFFICWFLVLKNKFVKRSCNFIEMNCKQAIWSVC